MDNKREIIFRLGIIILRKHHGLLCIRLGIIFSKVQQDSFVQKINVICGSCN